MNSWPGLGRLELGRWVARHGAGLTKRINSVSVLGPPDGDGAAQLAAGEAFLAGHGQPPMARVVSFAGDEAKAALDAAGYGAPFDPTVTLWRPLVTAPDMPEGVEIIVGAPSAEWLAAKDRLNEDTHDDPAARRAILACIVPPVAYGAVRGEDGQIAAVAYMALHGEIASLNMVFTDPALRGRRLSERVCQGLLAWAHAAGARQACLQVVEANLPARRLYARMGYSEPLYSYHYRAGRPA